MAALPKAVREAKRLQAAKAAGRKPQKPKKGSTYKPTLSEAHRAVVDAYFANGCVSQRRALLAAGYAENTAKNGSHTVFGRDDVKEEIERRHRGHERKSAITEERIINEYGKLAFSSLGDLLEVNEDGSAYLDFNRLTMDQKAAIAEYQVETAEIKQQDSDGDAVEPLRVIKSKIKFGSKQAALDSLARIKGMFKDRLEVASTQSLVERVQQARQRMAAEKEAKL